MTGLSDYEVWQISIAERTASSISLISVVFVLLTYLFSPAFNKPINRQIFYATWSNLGICLAGLISVDGYLGGEDKPLCRFQAFLVQMFLGVDAYWALCMAINVYLAFFSGYTIERLRALDPRYLVICYGASAIPALVFLFISTSRGPIYGDASLWCWVSAEWDFLRLAVVYVIVWVAILLSLIVYIKAGYVIYKRRPELDGFLNPWNEAPFSNMVVTEVSITHEDKDTSNRRMEGSARAGQEDLEHEDQIYSVNIEATPQKRPHGISDVLNIRTVTRGLAASDNNAESLLYARVAFLFFVSLSITWIPSSVNRIFDILHPNNPSFRLSLIAAILLPLQGFCNVVVYIITSRTACERLWARLSGRSQASSQVEARQERAGSGQQGLISDRGRSREGRDVDTSLSSIKSRMSRDRRGRSRGRRDFIEEIMMDKVGRERLGSQDEERKPQL